MAGIDARKGNGGGFSNSLLQTNRVSNPKVFIIINTTSHHIRPTDGNESKVFALDEAAKILEKEKTEVIAFLHAQGYSVDEDCIIENKSKEDIKLRLIEKIASIPENPLSGVAVYDSLIMWFLGIESESNDEIIYVEDGGISIDMVYQLFKTKPGIHKFIEKPKLFFFFKLPSIKRTVELQTTRVAPMRLPVDADFWTCLVNLPPRNEKDTITSMLTEYVRNTDKYFNLDDLMYYFKAKWSGIDTKLPLVSSTLRHDVMFFKSEKAEQRERPPPLFQAVNATDEETPLNLDWRGGKEQEESREAEDVHHLVAEVENFQPFPKETPI